MSGKFMSEEEQQQQSQTSIAAGQANAVQCALVGVHNTCGEAVVANGIAQYVMQGAGDRDKRQHWNEWVANLRDIYFAYVEGLGAPN